jgi:plastocyanin
MKINSGFLKAALLATAFSTVSQSAFCGGIVTGQIDATMSRYKKGAVVYLKGVPGKIKPKTAIIEQKNLEFTPHVIAIPTGSTVSFVNRDHVNHDIFSDDKSKPLDINNSKPGVFKKVVFDKEGAVNLRCTLHAEMSGYVVVVNSNYYAVTGDNGNFSIRNVPPGRYEVAVWSEKLKETEIKTVLVKEGRTSSVAINLVK